MSKCLFLKLKENLISTVVSISAPTLKKLLFLKKFDPVLIATNYLAMHVNIKAIETNSWNIWVRLERYVYRLLSHIALGVACFVSSVSVLHMVHILHKGELEAHFLKT